MIGWIVEKISSWGWRMKWRRLRPVTTPASVTAERMPGSEGGRNLLARDPAGLCEPAAAGAPSVLTGAEGPAPSVLTGAEGPAPSVLTGAEGPAPSVLTGAGGPVPSTLGGAPVS